MCPHRLPRGLAYSCFYALCSKFIPLINLPNAAFNKALRKLSDWLRLLVVYHFPQVALHLDRVVPAWETIVQVDPGTRLTSPRNDHNLTRNRP